MFPVEIRIRECDEDVLTARMTASGIGWTITASSQRNSSMPSLHPAFYFTSVSLSKPKRQRSRENSAGA